jgi:HEAT repeat protein
LKRRLLIGLAAVGIGLLGGVAVMRRAKAEPRYNGQSLKVWAMQLYAPGPEVRNQATATIRALGTNGVPGLIELLESRDPFWRKQLWRAGLNLPPKLRPGLLRHSSVPEQEAVHQAAAMALRIIGPQAKSAIPALARALRRRESAARWEVAFALASTGADSVPALCEALSDRDPEVRAAAAAGLAMLGAEAQPAIPALFQRLQDENIQVRLRAENALAAIGPSAAQEMIKLVNHEQGWTR